MKMLRRVREARGWSRAELARRARMHASTVGAIESGRLKPYARQVQKIGERVIYVFPGAVTRTHAGEARPLLLKNDALELPERIHEIRLSDNSSFWDQGYPALMLTDTSFLRNPNYHMAGDTPETLDYEAMTQVTLGVAGPIKRLLG